MTAHVLITGTLFRAAELRTGKTSGKPYVSATLKNASEFWCLVVFSETAQSELLRLEEGDALSVQGALRLCIRPRQGDQSV
jgi:hypothetical protein